MKKLKLSIEGMHCASCANNVQRSISGVKGVRTVSANAIFKSAKVEAEDTASIEDIKKAVGKLGYKVADIKEE